MIRLAAAILSLALPAVAHAKSPCDENPQLSKNGFVFKLTAPQKKDSLEVSFIYSRCMVDNMDSVENRETTPRAIRVYHADQAGWELWVETQLGADKSYLTLIEHYGGAGPKNAAWLGEYANAALLTSQVNLGRVSIRDTRAGTTPRTWNGAGTIKNAPFSRPDTGELKGCQ